MSCAQLDCRNDVLDVDIPVDTFAVYIVYTYVPLLRKVHSVDRHRVNIKLHSLSSHLIPSDSRKRVHGYV